MCNLKDVELLSQCIWANEYFKNKAKTLYFKQWIRRGIVYAKDLLEIIEIFHKNIFQGN